MKNQAFNPYLPSWEYIPDGEPHVFGDRVYVYGSHDAFGAPIFCVNDYVCWSAPVSDLSDWRYEGVIYRKRQDPGNPLGIRSLYAPDVTQGPDGRYYLYYAFDFLGEIGVAVCDTPAGQFAFYGKVHHRNGKIWGKKSGEQFPFDPGVLTDDDGRVWLYSGFAVKVPFPASRWHNLRNDGGVVMELESDMVTIRTEPRVLFPTKGKEGAFPHAFFEASSIRKVDGKYCFVYSSEHNHDLCWAMSDRPDGGFRYGGVLVDLGDLYLDGRTDEGHANNYLGNTVEEEVSEADLAKERAETSKVRTKALYVSSSKGVTRTCMLVAYYYYFNAFYEADEDVRGKSFEEIFRLFKNGLDSHLLPAGYQPVSGRNIIDVVVIFSSYAFLNE